MELTVMQKSRKLLRQTVARAEDPEFVKRYGARDTVEQLKECQALLRQNEALFNLESEEELIDCRIYEREALLARYSYLLRRIRSERAAAAEY